MGNKRVNFFFQTYEHYYSDIYQTGKHIWTIHMKKACSEQAGVESFMKEYKAGELCISQGGNPQTVGA